MADRKHLDSDRRQYEEDELELLEDLIKANIELQLFDYVMDRARKMWGLNTDEWDLWDLGMLDEDKPSDQYVFMGHDAKGRVVPDQVLFYIYQCNDEEDDEFGFMPNMAEVTLNQEDDPEMFAMAFLALSMSKPKMELGAVVCPPPLVN